MAPAKRLQPPQDHHHVGACAGATLLGKWLNHGHSTTSCMLQAVARAQCGLLIRQETPLHQDTGRARVTVQQLEADGMAELQHQGEGLGFRAWCAT